MCLRCFECFIKLCIESKSFSLYSDIACFELFQTFKNLSLVNIEFSNNNDNQGSFCCLEVLQGCLTVYEFMLKAHMDPQKQSMEIYWTQVLVAVWLPLRCLRNAILGPNMVELSFHETFLHIHWMFGTYKVRRR